MLIMEYMNTLYLTGNFMHTVQEVINPHKHISISFLYNFLMLQGRLFHFEMHNLCELMNFIQEEL